jgi:hypothetical protein
MIMYLMASTMNDDMREIFPTALVPCKPAVGSPQLPFRCPEARDVFPIYGPHPCFIARRAILGIIHSLVQQHRIPCSQDGLHHPLGALHDILSWCIWHGFNFNSLTILAIQLPHIGSNFGTILTKIRLYNGFIVPVIDRKYYILGLH